MNKAFGQVLSFIAILTLIAVACNLSVATPAAQNGGTIGGTVTSDLNGNGTSDNGEGPLEGAIISLSGCGENKTALSGVDGSFQLTGLPAGVCVLQVSKDGWAYSASYPNTGYPIPVTLDANHPSAVVIYLRPLDQGDQTEPTPAPAEPTATLAPTDIPLTATSTVPMVAAIDKGVNCRFGPNTYYAAIDALLVGSPEPIIGRTEDSSWWQVHSPSGGSGKCFVAASVTQTSGNLAGIPVVGAPDVSVTDVQLSVKLIEKQLCKEAIVDVRGSISVNGPTEVSYHYAVKTPTSSTEAAFTTVQYPEAGEYLIEFQELATECGDHSLTLVVTDPNQKSARDDFTVNGVP